jgi:diguanylate cyclase (GGDEF)-like protein/PAS domain S-box-containing protein
MTEVTRELVLLIEDERGTRSLLRSTLEREGLRVEECASGAPGLELLEQLRPDMVILSLVLPALDGFEILQKMRARRSGARVPIVVLSGLDDIAAMQRAYDMGATDVVTKPVVPTLLAHRVRYVLRAARAFENVARREANMVLAQRFAELGSWEWDVDANKTYWSDQIFATLGITAGSIVPGLSTYLEFVDERDREVTRAAFLEVLRGGAAVEVENRIQRRDGTHRIVQLRADVRTHQGKAAFMFGTVQDITQRRQREQKIQELAYYDSLTGLPNRRLFTDQLTRAISQAQRHNRTLVTMFLDVDDLKHINDTLGHDAGDSMLREVARRLMDCLRASDGVSRDPDNGFVEAIASVARIGGDEFTILLPEVNRADDAAVVARRVLAALSKSMVLVGQEIMISASLGVAVYPEDAGSAEDLLKAADTAMYSAKESAKGSFKFFTQPMNVVALKRLVLENELRRALQRQEFVLHFQPQVHVVRNEVVAVEALLRWNHPERGLLLPGEFLGTAENSGLIVTIGAWVVQQGAKQAKAWREMGMPVLPVTVNISAGSFRDKGFGALIRQALQAAQLEGRDLMLELTENALMRDTKEATAALEEIKALGVRLQVDDFGVGFSSLNRIKVLPIDSIKIDASFVRDIETDAAIPTTIIALARCMGLGVVAEGVETQAQADKLLVLGCEVMQGHAYGAPMPASRLESLIRQRYVSQ